MKKLLLFLLVPILAYGAAGDIKVSEANSTGQYFTRVVNSTANNTLWGFVSGNLTTLQLSGLSANTSTITANASNIGLAGIGNDDPNAAGFGGITGAGWYTGNPVLTVGANGTYDGGSVRDPVIFRARGQYWMLYSSTQGSSIPYNSTIAIASSPDGFTWTKLGKVISRNSTAGQWNSGGVFSPGVWYDNATDELWVFPSGMMTDDSAYYNGPHKIGQMKVAAGADWSNSSAYVWQNNGSYILQASQAWEGSQGVYSCEVTKLSNGTFLMLYNSGNSNYNIGAATASTINGTWTKFASNPLMPSEAEEAGLIPLSNGGFVCTSDPLQTTWGVKVFSTTNSTGMGGWTESGYVLQASPPSYMANRTGSSSATLMPDGRYLFAVGTRANATDRYSLSIFPARIEPPKNLLNVSKLNITNANSTGTFVNTGNVSIATLVNGPGGAITDVVMAKSAGAIMRLRETSGYGFSMEFLDPGGTSMGVIGYAGAQTGAAYSNTFLLLSQNGMKTWIESAADIVARTAGVERWRSNSTAITVNSTLALTGKTITGVGTGGISFNGTGAVDTWTNLKQPGNSSTSGALATADNSTTISFTNSTTAVTPQGLGAWWNTAKSLAFTSNATDRNYTSNATLTDISGMTISVVAGDKYLWEAYGFWYGSNTTAGGAKMRVNGPSGTWSYVSGENRVFGATTAIWGDGSANSTGYSFNPPSLDIYSSGAGVDMRRKGYVTFSANGTFSLQAAQYLSNTTTSTLRDAWFQLTRIP